MATLGLVCTTAGVTGSLQVTGKWTAKADGTYTDETVTTGDVELALPASCLNISGTTTTCERIGQVLPSLGLESASCTDAASGGGCTCPGTVKQNGWAGWLSTDATTSGNYKTASNVLTLDGETNYAYCVSGSKMTWTPKGVDGTPTVMTGTVVLDKGGSTGSGGAAGSGGRTGSGGAAGSGGRTGSGGATPSGGTTGSGGATPSGGATGSGGAAGSGGSTGNRADGPCDIYAAASPATPCVVAYSMVRALTKSYTGPLFQVRKNSSTNNTGTGGTTTDIGMLPDGFADTAAVDAFCAGTTCTVSRLYDHTGNANHIGTAKRGEYGCDFNPPDSACSDDYESSATKGAVTAGGRKVYSLYMNAREGYRTAVGLKGTKMPKGTEPQGIYKLADGTHSGNACCWDFGNVSPDPKVYGIMNTLFFGIGYWGTGAGSGPWFLADFEGGVWAGGSGASNANNPNNPSLKVPFAFGILKTMTGKYALRMADLAASDLKTAYEGALPKAMNNLQGIVLGVGGDNSNHSYGTFYEGAITAGYPSDATELAVFKNVKAVGYSK